MTPLPKRKHSKARSRIRRATLVTTLPQLVSCGHCGVRIIPHRVCPSCGYYAGKEVVTKKDALTVTTKSKADQS